MIPGTISLLVILALIWVFFKSSRNNNTALVAKTNGKIKQQSLAPHNVNRRNNIPPHINSTFIPDTEVVETPKALQELNLITSDDICETQQRATLTMMHSYKKPHPMLIALAKGQISQQELITIVKSDAKIAGRILFIVNSPRFSLQNPIKDINHAIMYLGLSEVRAIATELALKASFDSNNLEHEQSFNNIWQASALASSISLELGKVLGKDNASELSTLCLMFYLGDLILLSSNTESSSLYNTDVSFYNRINETQLKFKTNTSLIGSKAAEAWELPETMVKDIECSLSPLTNDQNLKSLSDEDKMDIIVCYLACRIAELAVFEQKTKVEKMNILNQEDCLHLEFFHISSMLSNYHLVQVKKLLKANDFIHRANNLISKHLY